MTMARPGLRNAFKSKTQSTLLIREPNMSSAAQIWSIRRDITHHGRRTLPQVVDSLPERTSPEPRIRSPPSAQGVTLLVSVGAWPT